MVRDESGRLHGPLGTERVQALIARGDFRGEELVCPHPSGKWVSISAAPEFSDSLLDALAREVQEADPDAKKVHQPRATSASVPTELSPAKPRSLSRTGESMAESSVHFERKRSRIEQTVRTGSSAAGDAADPQSFDSGHSGRSESTRDGPLELTDVAKLAKQERLRSMRLPLALIGAAALLLVFALLLSPGGAKARFHLLAPRTLQPEIDAQKGVAILARGLSAFEADGFTGYVRAQNEFVQLVEGMPNNPEGYSSLCLTYRELWPFAAQDSKDLKTLSAVATSARRVDPTGPHAAICEIVRLSLTGRYPEARGLVETWVRNVEGAAPLLEIQGSYALIGREYQTAQYFFESARRLRPRWLKAYVQEARARDGQRDYAGALALLGQVLRLNPGHQVARIELGILEQRRYHHDEKAIDLLSTGLAGLDKIPRLVEADGYLALAEAYRARNQSAKALAAARKSYALNSASADARRLIVELGGEKEVPSGTAESQDQLFLVEQYMQAGDCIRAQAAAKAAYELDRKNAVAAMRAAQCLWKLSQTADAIEWMKRAIAADSKLTPAYMDLAHYYGERFDYFSAQAVLKKLVALQPRSHEAYRGFAALELSQNNYKAAIQFADRSLQIYEMDGEAFLIVAKARMGLGEYVEAQKYAGRAMEIDPGDVEAKATNAKIVAGLRGTNEGAQYARQLIQDYPYVVEYRVALADVLSKDERYREALDAYNEARSILGNKPDKRVLIGTGKTLQALGRNTDALDFFLQAAILDPADAHAIFLAGGVHLEQGKYPDAISQFQRALRINPRFPRAHAQIGRANLKAGKPQDALKEADLERAANPNLTEAHLLAAEARFAMKDYAGCAQEYQKAVGLGRAKSVTYVALARCYRLSGGLDAAVSMLRQAEALESGNAELYKEYGATYHTKCMAEEAAKAYNTYLSLAPGAPDRADVASARDRAAQGDCSLGGAGASEGED